MIKIKIYRLTTGYREMGAVSHPVADYVYCVYFLGILIHSVTLHDIHRDSVKHVFGKKEILYCINKNDD